MSNWKAVSGVGSQGSGSMGSRTVGGGGGRGGRGPNAAALKAQQRLQRMMIGSEDDDDDDYQPPVRSQPRGGPPPQNNYPPRRGFGPPSPVVPRALSPEPVGSPSYGYPSEVQRPTINRRYGAEPDSGAPREIDQLRREATKLRDDIDVLTDENDFLLDKLKGAEDELKESKLRIHELEKQVANMEGGISLETRLITKKEAILRQKELALRAQKDQSRDVNQVELNALRLEAEAAKEEALNATELARQAESQVREFRQMTSRLLLTPEEKQEVALKRCWLARYWLLARHHGVHAEVAGPQAELWHGLAPVPFEYVMGEGQKAIEESRWANYNAESGALKDDRFFDTRELKDINSDFNVESMLLVEKGLRDLASLKVEEGVLLSMAQLRRPPMLRTGATGGGLGEGPRLHESVDLTEEEVQDVRFKQFWLVYFWRRAKINAVEPDLADDRLQYWIARTNFQPKLQDAVDAERGLLEMRKLGLEQQLWETSRAHAAEFNANRRGVSPVSSVASLPQHDYSSPSVRD